MTTAALTLQDFAGKFEAIQQYVTTEVLELINRSETFKTQIRTYNNFATPVREVVLVPVGSPGAGAASFNIPVADSTGLVTSENRGYATFGANRINTAEGFVFVVSHELGHFQAEGPGSIVGNARDSAYAASDRTAYENACHLTEGYARLADRKSVV